MRKQTENKHNGCPHTRSKIEIALEDISRYTDSRHNQYYKGEKANLQKKGRETEKTIVWIITEFIGKDLQTIGRDFKGLEEAFAEREGCRRGFPYPIAKNNSY